MGPARWRRADESDFLAHCESYLEDPIYYARIYTAGMGFGHSDSNQLVLNLKIDPSQDHRIFYKNQAIERFAQETVDFVKGHPEVHFDLVPVPPSKLPEHPDYDDRIERAAKRVAELCPQNSRCRLLLRATAEIEPFHHRPGSRSWRELLDVLETVPDGAVPASEKEHFLVVFDDVLTSGAHYEAARHLLLEAYPEQEIRGICWAKAERLDDEGLD